VLKKFNWKFCKILLIFLMIANLQLARASSKKVRLTYSPKKGSLSSYKTVVIAKADVTSIEGVDVVEGTFPQSITNATFISDEKIEEVDKEGNITMAITFREVDIQLKIGGSTESISLPVNLEGKSLRFKMDKRGKIIEGAPELFAEELQELNLNMDDIFKQYKPDFPDKKVGIGDSWDSEFTSQLPIEGQLVSTSVKNIYSVSGFEKKRGYETIAIDMNMGFETTTNTLKKKDFMADVVMNGKGEGQFYYDYSNSRIIESDMNIDVDVKLVTQTFNQKRAMEMSQSIDLKTGLMEK